jgi:alkylated DNA repair dioxygenase AlkB
MEPPQRVWVREEDQPARGPGDPGDYFLHMIAPGGFRMSAAMTNCGTLGWVTDRTGFPYDAIDPVSGLLWPLMPGACLRLATGAV